jgi:hypothetical protein
MDSGPVVSARESRRRGEDAGVTDLEGPYVSAFPRGGWRARGKGFGPRGGGFLVGRIPSASPSSFFLFFCFLLFFSFSPFQFLIFKFILNFKLVSSLFSVYNVTLKVLNFGNIYKFPLHLYSFIHLFSSILYNPPPSLFS